MSASFRREYFSAGAAEPHAARPALRRVIGGSCDLSVIACYARPAGPRGAPRSSPSARMMASANAPCACLTKYADICCLPFRVPPMLPEVHRQHEFADRHGPRACRAADPTLPTCRCTEQKEVGEEER